MFIAWGLGQCTWPLDTFKGPCGTVTTVAMAIGITLRNDAEDRTVRRAQIELGVLSPGGWGPEGARRWQRFGRSNLPSGEESRTSRRDTINVGPYGPRIEGGCVRCRDPQLLRRGAEWESLLWTQSAVGDGAWERNRFRELGGWALKCCSRLVRGVRYNVM